MLLPSLKFRTAIAVLVLVPIFGAVHPAWAATTTAAPTATTALPWQQVKLLADVMQLVKQDYVAPVDDATLINNAIRGMLAGLDPHSDYLDKSDYQQLQILTTDRFSGLGLEVTQRGGAVTVAAPIDGSPAAKAGLQSGDVIVRVDHTTLDGLTLDQAVALMRGAPGTAVTLVVLRRGAPKPLTFTLTRAEVQLTSVHGRLLQAGYGYLRISQFSADTADGVRAALAALVKQNHGALQGLVLDLRNNPGGLLDAAVEVSDDFLTSGVIVSGRGRAPDSNFLRRATPGDMLNGAPMVVLVNAGTASAAEITAGALKDDHRALILGTRTFGKGSVQTVIPLPEGGALKLTTSLYYTPTGRSIQAEGIAPDLVVPEFRLSAPAAATDLTEANLEGHFANNAPTPEAEGTLPANEQLAQQDFQLYTALNVLKGLTLAGSH